MKSSVGAFSTIALVVLLTGWVSPAKAYAEPQQEKFKSVWEGVYSEDQIMRGAVDYINSCAGCHRADLSGAGGALKESFMIHWQQDNLNSIFSFMQANMPANKPGSLMPDTYVDILAFILEENGFPAGGADLKPEGLNLIRILPKDGSLTSLPAGALAETYGCIVEGPDKTWQLSHATTFVRTRSPEKSSDGDLKLAEIAPAGMETYQLLDTTFLHPERHISHKVEVKGFVGKESEKSLNVVSLTMVSATCQ